MTVMRKVLYNIFTGVALLAFASCANDDLQQNGVTVVGDGRIEFTATTTNTVNETRGGLEPLAVTGYKKQLWLIPTVEDVAKDATRGTQFTSQSILDNFGVSAYLHGRTEDITEKRPDFFYNKEAVRDATTGKYGFDQIFYWPSGNEYLSFMAYAPYGSNLATLADVNASEPAKGAQKISFTVAANVTDQIDLMTATAMQQYPSTTGTPNVNLQFEHQLAGIRFVVGQQFPTQGYIQKITLKNVYASGIYTLSDGATPGSWTYGSRYDYVAGTADQELTGEVGQSITTDAQTFLMLPCSFPDNDEAEVEIDYWDGYEVHTVSASLENVTWEAGKTYTYELSSQNLTKLRVQSIAFAPTIEEAPHSKWQTGDKVGLYVVQGKDAQGDPDGHTLRYTNIPIICTVSTVGSEEVVTWTVDHTTAQGNVYKIPGDSYYFYYPYKEGTPSGYPNECNELDASATTFFSSVINAHTVHDDQSDVGSAIGHYEDSDLQVGRAIVPEDANSQLPASTIKGSLARQVGLAVIEMPAVSILTDSVFLNNVFQEGMPRTDVKAAVSFVTNIPRQSGEKFYYFVKPSTSSTVFNSETGLEDSWRSSVDVSLSAGETGYYNAYSRRSEWTYIRSIRWDYNYTGAVKTFTCPWDGVYTIECWGAQGAGYNNTGADYGRGGYVKGNLSLIKDAELYVRAGGSGAHNGWNGGGGNKGYGGGATDLRTGTALTTRFIVAAGGGGGSHGGYGGAAGGINGYVGTKINSTYTGSSGMAGGGTQTSGGAAGYFNYNSSYGPTSGSFGQGGRGNSDYGGGGGGGWYGGGGAGVSPLCWAAGGGGSSYISGYSGCPTVHSTYSFLSNSMTMIDGKNSMTAPDGTAETGHAGDGYARISYPHP